ncbi:efflux RND transporter periplasmic adaptor subunit [Gephyromycinifex aptenodytis]|uniref:efflux RND transporter periplasmic adaptor subunit n=1 Tax=Gephyromycinifex aptenodytis TaxID=2716227 RepID=UPI001447FBBB|nr:HlyD family efflux transporter periplasmic adaptor subunit [Gephyromycinifex aptenodytis]
MFPIVWMVLVAVIAASLAKMAFFGPTSEAGGNDGAAPSADFDEFAAVAVAKGDITSTLELPATVQADPGATVAATHAGEVNKIWVANGDTISKGDPILQVRAPKESMLAPPAEPAGSDPAAAPAAPVQPKPEFTYHTLYAPRSGTVRALSAVNGQTVEVGANVATLSPGTYSSTAALTPQQHLQLLDRDVAASAELPTSTAPVPCDSPKVEEDETAANAPAADPMNPVEQMGMPGMGGDAPATSSAHLLCPMPSSAKVVPGLSVKVKVDLGSAKGVLTLPTTAVQGVGDQGSVFLLDPVGGEPTAHPVTLGLRGKDTVQVVKGLKAGQKVLQFVPGIDSPEDPMGGGMNGGTGW